MVELVQQMQRAGITSPAKGQVRHRGSLGHTEDVHGLEEASQLGVCVLIMIALAVALVGVWRDDHDWLD